MRKAKVKLLMSYTSVVYQGLMKREKVKVSMQLLLFLGHRSLIKKKDTNSREKHIELVHLDHNPNEQV